MAFDIKVDHINPKTMRVEKSDPYALHCSKDHGQLFERPIGSKIFYHPDGTLYDSPEMQEKKAADEMKAAAAKAAQAAKAQVARTPATPAGIQQVMTADGVQEQPLQAGRA